jgi:ABC-type transporter Mla subunit MlaD
MYRRVDTFKVGLVMIFVLALFVATLLFVAGAPMWGKSMRTVKVRFRHTDGVAGLQADSSVLLAGLKVGRVTDVRLQMMDSPQAAPDRPAQELFALVTAQIDARFPLQSDCMIHVTAPPLGGSGTLVIADIGSSGKALAAGEIVEGQPPAGLSQLVDQLGPRLVSELDEHNPRGLLQLVKSQLNAEDPSTLLGKVGRSLDDLNAITAQISVQLDPAGQRTLLAKLHATMDSLNELTANLRDETDSARGDVLIAKVHEALDLLSSALATTADLLTENRPAITSAIQHVDGTLAQMDNQVLPSIAVELDRDQAGSLMDKVHGMVDETDEVVGDLSVTARTVRELVAFHKTDLSRTVENLRVASEYAKELVRDVLFHPWRLMRPGPEEREQLDVLAAARSFADAAARLDDATATLRSLVEARSGELGADDPQLLAVRRELELTFDNFKQAESALWQLLQTKSP